MKMTKIVKSKFFILAAVVVLLVALVWGFFLFGGKGTENPEDNAAQRTVVAVSKLIVLPENETPTIAEVTDIQALKDQPFFAKAKIGDQVLIYAAAGKAYLYDPTANKILEVAPVTFGEN